MNKLLEYEQIGGEKVDGIRTEISYNVFYTSNLCPLGQIYKEVDGLYVYQPRAGVSGCWSGEVLKELGQYLITLNREENNEQVDR